MSFELPVQHRGVQPRVRWLAASFLVEAMLLVLFVMVSLAVLTAMFAQSAERAEQSRVLTEAVALAQASAERFAANPAAAEDVVSDGLAVVCDVTDEKRAAGTMHRATIAVYEAEGAVLEALEARASARGESPAGLDDSAERKIPQVKGTPIYKLSTAKYESGV